MTHLSVNLNKVALLRNTRPIGIPSVTRAAQICIEAGAHGITVHPRPDRRHILPEDVRDLAAMLTVELNIEGNPFHSYMDIIREIKPDQATLVPDDPNQKTSDHGWNLKKDGERLMPIIEELKSLGVRVSLFMDPDKDQIARAKEVGADRIELYTEPYAAAFRECGGADSIKVYAEAARFAQEVGLGVNAGHDLNLRNLETFLSIGGILEVSIGHALIAEALEMGLDRTVREYLRIVSRS